MKPFKPSTPSKVSKYGNKRVTVDGIIFDSKREAVRYQTLKTMEKAGVIKDLKRQVEYVLVPKIVIAGEKTRPVKYIADFVYEADGQIVVEDSKGFRTDVFKLKRILMKHLLGIEINEV